jgi:hypothetical protein
MEPTTYIDDSYHKTTTFTIENDANPLKYMIFIMHWYTLGDPPPYISGSCHKTTTFVIGNYVSPLDYLINIVRQHNKNGTLYGVCLRVFLHDM